MSRVCRVSSCVKKRCRTLNEEIVGQAARLVSTSKLRSERTNQKISPAFLPRSRIRDESCLWRESTVRLCAITGLFADRVSLGAISGDSHQFQHIWRRWNSGGTLNVDRRVAESMEIKKILYEPKLNRVFSKGHESSRRSFEKNQKHCIKLLNASSSSFN